MELLTTYRLPLGDGIEWLVLFLSRNLRAAFDAFSVAVRAVEGGILGLLTLLPAPLVIAALAALAWRLAGRGLALFTLVALPIVYLIPAVMFFGLGPVPGIIATVIFAVALPIRLTNLGLRQVPVELTEAGEAFGCSRRQLLFKVQIPMAMPSIMAGVNQTIMMCLSMVIGLMTGKLRIPPGDPEERMPVSAAPKQEVAR